MKRSRRAKRWITAGMLTVALLVSAVVASTCVPDKVEPLPIPVSSSPLTWPATHVAKLDVAARARTARDVPTPRPLPAA